MHTARYCSTGPGEAAKKTVEAISTKDAVSEKPTRCCPFRPRTVRSAVLYFYPPAVLLTLLVAARQVSHNHRPTVRTDRTGHLNCRYCLNLRGRAKTLPTKAITANIFDRCWYIANAIYTLPVKHWYTVSVGLPKFCTVISVNGAKIFIESGYVIFENNPFNQLP